MADVDDTRLGALLDRFQQMCDADPNARIEDLRAEAGPLYDELVELTACLDLMRASGTVSPPEPAATAGPSRTRRILLGLLLVGVIACLAWVAVSAAANGAKNAGAEGPSGNVPVPEDPFDIEALKAMASSLGMTFKPLPADVPTPTSTASAPPAAHAPGDTRTLAVERERFPASLRDTDAARYLLAVRLVRLGHDDAALDLALALAEQHPDRAAPLRVALHALSGLGQVGSPRYADLHARYLGASSPSSR